MFLVRGVHLSVSRTRAGDGCLLHLEPRASDLKHITTKRTVFQLQSAEPERHQNVVHGLWQTVDTTEGGVAQGVGAERECLTTSGRCRRGGD